MGAHIPSLLDLSSNIGMDSDDKIQSINFTLNTASGWCRSSQATSWDYGIKTNYFEFSEGTVWGRLVVIFRWGKELVSRDKDSEWHPKTAEGNFQLQGYADKSKSSEVSLAKNLDLRCE